MTPSETPKLHSRLCEFIYGRSTYYYCHLPASAFIHDQNNQDFDHAFVPSKEAEP